MTDISVHIAGAEPLWWHGLAPGMALGLTPVRAFVSDAGSGRDIGLPEARELWGREPLIVANATLMRSRLFGNRQSREARHFDVLELFAFIRPAQFCAPSAAGLALTCGYDEPETPQAQAQVLASVVSDLCETLKTSPLGFRLAAQSGVKLMAKQGWVWAPLVQAVLDRTELPADYVLPPALDIWPLLEEWEDQPPEGQARAVALSEEEVTQHLGRDLQRAGLDERRPEQLAFALKAREIFAPKWMKDQPNMWLLEAGTGVGKTLGYLAPAHAWAEKAQGQVWISTYTKALQKQIHHDTRALFDNPHERADKVVVRKGRENYVCLLNFQERLAAMHSAPELIMAVLVARWALYSRDGDIMSGDFPTWLPSLLPPGTPAQVFQTLTPGSLVDRRGECTYAACPHYRVCFIEKSVRKARSASLVIANHALVMSQATYDLRDRARADMQAQAEGADVQEDADGPALSRIIFDEGHHVFEAADSAFATRLSGLEAYELRRWIRGNEGRSRRGRGLEARLGDLVAGSDDAKNAMKELIRAAHVLPSDGFSTRLGVRTQSGGGLDPVGPIEALLVEVYQQIDIRQGEARLRSRFSPDNEQGGECEAHPCIDGVAAAAKLAARALAGIEAPLLALVRALEDRLNSGAELEPADRIRIEGALRGLERRARLLLPAWRSLLQKLAVTEGEAVVDEVSAQTIDWFSTEVIRGRIVDVCLNRHYVDPSLPLAEFVLKPAHGILVASATLSDGTRIGEAPSEDEESDRFALARQRTGANHLVMGARTARIASPFDYAHQARLFVVTDVSRDDPRATGAAMEALFKAAKGGSLGLFTAIRRLKAVYEQINRPLGEAGLSLYAQHVDPLDVSDLISVFRSEHHSCLLGTDAVRDGIDVPGQALRLIAFDRIPWPRPDTLHRARRQHFGNKLYDDALTRAKLAQAFGRLIRKADDRGVFVMLDSAAPTRLFSGLPEGVVLQRCTLAEALESIAKFLHG